MKKVLVTAFEPYDRWKTNASWLALVHLTQDLPPQSPADLHWGEISAAEAQ